MSAPDEVEELARVVNALSDRLPPLFRAQLSERIVELIKAGSDGSGLLLPHVDPSAASGAFKLTLTFKLTDRARDFLRAARALERDLEVVLERHAEFLRGPSSPEASTAASGTGAQ
ncbi:MAG: hypothetical protein KF718_33175 [Polyangiaceae bacterium]|nr:hypothetical protein [Polyangiaceae bacterium]